jgi:cytochrome c2
MWNHSIQMDTAGLRKAFEWPVLSSQDVADLLIYLRSIPALRVKSTTFSIGEPELGRITFERSCESCHSFGPGPGKTIDLLAQPAPAAVTGYVASMWNHALIMQARSGIRFPRLESGEMSNLIAFLFSQSYFFERGNDRRGRRVFENKRCAQCHEDQRRATRAPDLAQAFELYSPITLTSAVWRHGPAMLQTMRQNATAWPRFEGSEMADLIAYLNSRVIVRLAPR